MKLKLIVFKITDIVPVREKEILTKVINLTNKGAILRVYCCPCYQRVIVVSNEAFFYAILKSL